LEETIEENKENEKILDDSLAKFKPNFLTIEKM